MIIGIVDIPKICPRKLPPRIASVDHKYELISV
jgi:hypothetical protein